VSNYSTSVISTATNTVIASIPVGSDSVLVVSPDGSKVYVIVASAVSVIDTTTDAVIARITVGSFPENLAVTPDGSKVYVTNEFSGTVSVINTATNTVIATIPVGFLPVGIVIQPPPRFAGVPGSDNCHGTSVSTLATKFGGLDAAAAALGFSSVQGLQDAIKAFCQG
jgi:YVTN family beta-propeller protein